MVQSIDLSSRFTLDLTLQTVGRMDPFVPVSPGHQSSKRVSLFRHNPGNRLRLVKINRITAKPALNSLHGYFILPVSIASSRPAG